MTVMINYKKYNNDDSYDIKFRIEKYCDGVISYSENQLLLVQGEDLARFYDVVSFSIIND